MKLVNSTLLVATTTTVAIVGIQGSYAADILGEAPPTGAPYYTRPYSYQPPEYRAPGYEPVPAYPRYESRYGPTPVPRAAIYGGPAAGSQVYETRVYAAPDPRYAPAQPCYWTRGEPTWNGYAWSRRPVQVCD